MHSLESRGQIEAVGIPSNAPRPIAIECCLFSLDVVARPWALYVCLFR